MSIGDRLREQHRTYDLDSAKEKAVTKCVHSIQTAVASGDRVSKCVLERNMFKGMTSNQFIETWKHVCEALNEEDLYVKIIPKGHGSEYVEIIVSLDQLN